MNLINEICELLNAAESILLVTHVSPDGDNMGSGLALQEALRSRGKDVRFYIEGLIPRIYTWLPGADGIESSLPEEYDESLLVVALDSGDLGRMGGEFKEWWTGDLTLVNVDHHISNVEFGDVNWVEPEYSSTGEMVIEIMDFLGVPLNRENATCIFCAVYTDTGRFSYSNTNERSFAVAARCLDAGADPHEIYSKVYAARTQSGLRLLTKVLDTLRFFAGDSACAFHVDLGMFAETGTDMADTESFLEAVTQVGELRLVAFLKQIGPNEVKISLRCRQPINAYELALKFGGGGHPRAAGFSVNTTIEEAYELFINEAEKALVMVED